MTRGSTDSGGLRSLDRGLLILAYVQDQGQVTVPDIVRDLGIPLSTTYRYVAALVRSGFLVEFDNLVVASQRLADMSRDQHARLKVLAAPVLDELSLRTQQSACLTVRVHLASLSLAVRRAHYSVVSHREGRALALYAGASATPLLAMAPPEVRERVLGGRITAFTQRTPSREQLRREVARIPVEGYHLTRGWLAPGMTAVGVPVMVGDHCAGALSVIGTDASTPDEPLALRAALNDASTALARRISVDTQT